jgi:heterodisulfide reductase subunit D
MTNNVTLWVGCTSRRYLEGTVHSFEKILSYLGKTLDIIDDTDNACCGSVLYGTGQEAEANANIENTDKLLSEKSVEDMVTMCSGCMKTFGERYTFRKSNPLKTAKHVSQFLVDNLDNLHFKNDTPMVVTYHDPCHLGRHMGIMEEPRTMIKAVPNVTLKEMKHNLEGSFCCGSGGGVRAYNKDMADSASAIRVAEAISTGAKYFITACPFCERSFISAQANKDGLDGIEVINLVDFIAGFLE